MGITISSKRYSCDMSYHGFGRFRNAVAEKVNEEFHSHYMKLSETNTILLFGDERKKYFDKYDAITKDYINKNIVTPEIANFLYQSDCGGKIDKNQAKQIYALIKDCDNNISFGYLGRKDCAKMLNLKNIFSDNTKVKWC